MVVSVKLYMTNVGHLLGRWLWSIQLLGDLNEQILQYFITLVLQ